MATFKFTMTSQLRSTLALNDDLGFDNAVQAADAILRHNDWEKRWTVEDEEHITFLNKWRAATIKENKANPKDY